MADVAERLVNKFLHLEFPQLLCDKLAFHHDGPLPRGAGGCGAACCFFSGFFSCARSCTTISICARFVTRPRRRPACIGRAARCAAMCATTSFEVFIPLNCAFTSTDWSRRKMALQVLTG